MNEPESRKPLYQERVVPGVGLFLATLALLPAIALVSEPFDLSVGILLGSFAVAATWFSLIYWAPKIIVTETQFLVGSAQVPRSLLGEIAEIPKEEIFQERGPRLDPKAFTSFQSSVKTAIKVGIRDKNDPTPYWLISTRNPERLKSVLASKT